MSPNATHQDELQAIIASMECAICHTALPAWAVYCHACGALQPEAAEQTRFDYAAFISYRHLPRDQQVAMEVQKAIETYKLPRGIRVDALGEAGDEGAGGVSAGASNASNGAKRQPGASLGKCFRDEDELSATHSLPDRITSALARSRALVVICSPETPNSPWVQREIETFAQLHGRERIVVVLAEGSSAESIPDLLKSRMAVLESGDVRTVSASPLAADLRPNTSADARLEMLRIIAAVAGCEFDDLRQRSKSRKRKRILAAALTAAVAIAAVAALVFFAVQGARDAQISESKRLAAESEQLLTQGDRYGAIETALSALPNSESDRSRPIVPEARTALEDALEVNPPTDSAWQASYSIQTEHPLTLVDDTTVHPTGEEAARVSAVGVSERGSFFAVSDDEGAVATYDLKTGRKLANCEMPADATPTEDGVYVRTLATTGDSLIVGNAVAPGVVACFDAATGTLRWSISEAVFPMIDTSFNDDYACMVQPNAKGCFSAAVVDVKTGKLVAARDFTEPGTLSTSSGMCAVNGKRMADLYAAFGNTLVGANLSTGAVKTATLAYPFAASINYADGVLVVATADNMPENDVWRDFAIEAFDDSLNPLWSYKGTLTSEMIADSNYVALLAAEPAVHGFTLGNTGVAVSAGREAFVFDRANGKETFHRSYDQTVVDMKPVSNEQAAYDKTFIAASDGTIAQKDLSGTGQDREGDSERLALPFPIRWANVSLQDDATVAITLPANANDRIVAFHIDYSHDADQERERSLDELISLAHETLDQANSGSN